MDIITVLLTIAGILLFYQLFLKKDDDELDGSGHEVRKKVRWRLLNKKKQEADRKGS